MAHSPTTYSNLFAWRPRVDRFSSSEPEPDLRRCVCGHVAEDHTDAYGDPSEGDACFACDCRKFQAVA